MPDNDTAYARTLDARSEADLDSYIGGDPDADTSAPRPGASAPGPGRSAQPAQADPMQFDAEGITRFMLRTIPVLSLATDPGQRRVIGDIVRGVSEDPKQIVGGIADAVGATTKGILHLGDWFDQNVFDTTIPGTEDAREFVEQNIVRLGESIAPAKTVSAGMVREAAQFITGFVPALRAVKAAGVTGAVTAPVAAGGLASFAVLDPDEANIAASLAPQVPASFKPIVDILATNPNDPEIINRARNAAEGLGLGGLTEGVIRGLRVSLNWARGKGRTPTQDPMQAAREQYGEVTPEQTAPLGDPTKPAVSLSPKIAAAERATDGRVAIPTNDGKGMYINFARINEPADVQDVMARMATEFRSSIDEARRGVVTDSEVAKLADGLGMSVDDLMARRKGQAFNAEEVLAARNLWGASAQKLTELAERAASPNAGNVDRFMFRKMMATHYAIQAEVLGVRAESGRALRAWSLQAQGGVEQAKAIQAILDEQGGEAVSSALAKRIAQLGKAGVSPDAINAAIRKGWGATTMDAVRESYIQGLLWGPQTHIVNTLSNGFVAAQQIAERYGAELIAGVRGAEAGEGVAAGEAAAMLASLSGGVRDAVRMAGRALKTGERGQSVGKVEEPFERAISSEAFGRAARMKTADLAAFTETGLGKAIDYFGTATNMPGRLLAAEDEFFKTIGYRMELYAQAHRTALADGYGRGTADYAKRFSDLVANPPENIRLQAADAALYNTFQSVPPDVVRKAMLFREKLGPVGWMLAPFVRTPANILMYTLERTPAAPILARFRADVAAGGARRDIALARIASGTAITMFAFDMAESGLVTGAGPSNPGEREALMRTGWRPFSFRIGNTYVGYNRGDPLAMPFRLAAIASERFKQAESSPEDLDEWEEALAAAVGIAGEAAKDVPWFQGFAQLGTSIQDATRANAETSSTTIERLLAPFAGNVVPFATLSRTINRAVDPILRESRGDIVDSMVASLPILNQTLPPRRTIWGEPLKPQEVWGRPYDVLSPFPVSEDTASPIDTEMARIHASSTRIPVRESFAGADVNFRDYPNVYDRYVRLAGNEAVNPGTGYGAKDYLNALVTGQLPESPLYDDAPDAMRRDLISQTIGEYREIAQQEIMDNPQTEEEQAFVREVNAKLDAQVRERMPLSVLQQ